MNFSILPMQWTGLADLPDVPPVGDGDLDCLAEIRDVLARHGKLNRFAVHLAHRHFALGPDEILIERPDPDGRTQHVTVGRLADEPDARPTTWLFEQGASCFFQTRSIAFASPIRTGPMPASATAKAARPAGHRKEMKRRSSGALRRKRTNTIAAFPSPATTNMSRAASLHRHAEQGGHGAQAPPKGQALRRSRQAGFDRGPRCGPGASRRTASSANTSTGAGRVRQDETG